MGLPGAELDLMTRPVGAVGNRRSYAGFPRARGKRWTGLFLLDIEAVHGFPQPGSVRGPLGAKRRLAVMTSLP
jgi:hypothetical protein